MSNNRYSLFSDDTDETVSCKPKLLVPDTEFDSQSLDSTGKSWADMDDDFTPVVRQTAKVVVQGSTEDDGFTLVLSRENKKKQKSQNCDMTIKCIHCGIRFEFPHHKVALFESRGWQMPKRCKSCLGIRKTLGSLPKLQTGQKKIISLD